MGPGIFVDTGPELVPVWACSQTWKHGAHSCVDGENKQRRISLVSTPWGCCQQGFLCQAQVNMVRDGTSSQCSTLPFAVNATISVSRMFKTRFFNSNDSFFLRRRLHSRVAFASSASAFNRQSNSCCSHEEFLPRRSDRLFQISQSPVPSD